MRIASVRARVGYETYGVADDYVFTPPEYPSDWTEITKSDGTTVFFAPHQVLSVNVYDELGDNTAD